MMATKRLVTAEELLLMGSDARYELIEGELLEYPFADFRVAVIAGHLTFAIHQFVMGRYLGHVTGRAGYVVGRHPDTVIAP